MMEKGVFAHSFLDSPANLPSKTPTRLTSGCENTA